MKYTLSEKGIKKAGNSRFPAYDERKSHELCFNAPVYGSRSGQKGIGAISVI